jgi:putative oxygen-independent coproporphyrinogen III oxidase
LTEPAPLGVYIHWPYCARICPYCDFNVFKVAGRNPETAQLADAILADLAGQAAITGPRQLVSIFFGGGTPSLMDPAWVAEIIAHARRLWTPVEDVEVSLEANPTDAEADRFTALAEAGVNRLSLGLQSLDDRALKFLGRNHDAAEGLRAAAVAARAFPRLSLDAIYARPGQSVSDWREELTRIVDLGAEHISPYQLTLESGTAFDRAVRRGLWTPPEEDAAAELFEATQAVLIDAGYEAYEVSNHARGIAARSRHNLVYWRGWDYVGVGPGAHGRITKPEGRIASEAALRPADYVAAVAARGIGFLQPEALTVEAVAEERLLSGLRILDGVPFDELAALRLRPDSPVVRRLVGLDLVADDAERLRATPAGRRVLDRLTADLVLQRPI